jgi:hypothetical protein
MKSAAFALGMFVCGLGLASTVAISSVGSGQEKANPTQIQVGVMTERQRVHSKLFQTYSGGRKLDEPLQDRRPGKEAVEATEETIYLEPGITVTSADVPVLSFGDFLKDLSCHADAAVMATAKNGISHLTENREFLFTDYVVTVDEVFKDNPSAFIAPNSDMTVTRPGGRVQIKTRIVNALDSSFQLLVTGKRYLLFLRYIPETGSYRSLRKGSFLVQDDDLIPLTEEAIPAGSVDPNRVLSAEIRAVLTSGCDRNN